MKRILAFSLLTIGTCALALTPGQERQIKDAYKRGDMQRIQVIANASGQKADVNKLVASLGGNKSSLSSNDNKRPAMPAHQGTDASNLLKAFNDAQSMSATDLGTMLVEKSFNMLLQANPERAKMVLSRLVDAVYPQATTGNQSKAKALGHLGKKEAKRKRK